MQLRLVGLMLFVTSIFLGLIAAATKTATIDVKRPDWHRAPAELGSQTSGSGMSDPASPDNGPRAQPLEFISVPILWPLSLAGGVGLLLWFIPSPLTNPSQTTRRRRRRRRR